MMVQRIPDDPNEKTSGGIYLTEAAAEIHNKRLSTGVVVAMGPDGFEHGQPLTANARVGDRIIYANGAAIKFRFKKSEYEIVHFTGHVATLEE